MNKGVIRVLNILSVFIVLFTFVFAQPIAKDEKIKINIKIEDGTADIKAKVDKQEFEFEDLTDKVVVLSETAQILNVNPPCTDLSTLPIGPEEKIKIKIKIKGGVVDFKAKVYGNENEKFKLDLTDKGEILSNIASIFDLSIVDCGLPPPPG